MQIHLFVQYPLEELFIGHGVIFVNDKFSEDKGQMEIKIKFCQH